MLQNRSIAVFLAMVLFSAHVWAQTPAFPQSPSRPVSELGIRTPQSASAPAAAARFREIASELANSKSITGSQADQAIILLIAARNLDHGAAGIEPLLLRLATRNTQKDYSDQVMLWLGSYVGESADRGIVLDAVHYLVDRLSSIEQRKEMLETLVKRIGNRNAAIDSELATLLGLLMIEKGDTEAARFYLLQAYTNNKYNKAAFAKLAELTPNEIGPAVYLEHLRLMLQENPLNINGAVGFAQYAERLQLYDLSALSYQYCAELFRYLYPSDPVPPHVYLPWAINCYNSRQGLQTCLQIAESVRSKGRFDLLLEAVAGKAAKKAGDQAKAQQIFRQAEQTAWQLLKAGPTQPQPAPQGMATPTVQVNAKQLAWFYCFADIDPGKALVWSNQAHTAEPNSPSAAALVAYALSMGNDLESAKSYLAAFEPTQIADLVQARIQSAAGNKAGAEQTLQAAIAKDAGSLAAEKAKEMLKSLGREYVSPVDTGALMTYLTQNLGKAAAPQFHPPDKAIGVQFSLRGRDYSYGNELEGLIGITSRGVEPLVITADGLIQGNIRVDARVGGGIQRDIAGLVSQTIRTDLIVAPGRSLVHTVKLSTGELRDILMTHPQAALDIQFTLYLDPVATPDRAISNRLIDVKPATVAIQRPALEITESYVRNRYNAIATGQEGQKIQTARLFTGLLKEQHAMAERTLYPYRYADWLPELLRSSLLNPSGLLLGQGRDDWVVMVNAMADMLSMPIDPELANAVAKNLNHPQWPVRLMAVYLLASRAGNNLQAVLDWVAQRDANELVRSIAMSLQPGSASMPALTVPAAAPTGRSLTLWP